MKMLRKIISLVCLFSILLTPLAPLVSAEEVKSADEIYNGIAKVEETNPSQVIAIYLEGYELYPEDERFENYIIEHLEEILNWSKDNEQSNQWEEALRGYKVIIDIAENHNENNGIIVPEEILIQCQKAMEVLSLADINDNLVEEVEQSDESSEKLLEDTSKEQGEQSVEEIEKTNKPTDAPESALEEEVLEKTPASVTMSNKGGDDSAKEELLIKAQNSPYASEKFNLYIKGYELYPSDDRFREGVASSAVNILNLGKKYHNQGNFDAAVNYYDRIIDVDSVPKEIRETAQKNKALAQADKMYTQAQNSPYASEKFNLYIQGYELYPNDNRFKEGISSSAINMLNLGKNYHKQGNFDTAIGYYNAILNAPAVPKETIDMVNRYQELAKSKEILLTENELYNKANNSPYASEKFNLYIKGYELYPNDSRFKEGVASSAVSILNLGKKYHNQGNFDAAVNYYDRIIDVDSVPKEIRETAQKNKALAQADKMYTQAQNSPYASEKFNLYIQGYELYPNDNRFKEGISSSAINMLNLGKNYHKQGNFDTAIGYYNAILNAPAVPKETIDMVNRYQELAKSKEILLTENELYNKANNSPYASEKFNLYIKGYELYPNDSRFKEGVASSAV
ncbi:tetratricopeptide repeat protein, partial [Irregularibacter muris]